MEILKLASASIIESKGLLKETLMGELKAYRNISIKLAILSWSLSLAGHYCYTVFNKDAMSIQIMESLYQSFLTSLVFALVGYCLGTVLGAHLQHKRLDDIKRKRIERKRYIEEQVSIRQAKLQGL